MPIHLSYILVVYVQVVRIYRDRNIGWSIYAFEIGIFGENDPLFVPTLVNNAKRGKMKYYIGDGTNRMDWTFVDNVAYALELAAGILCFLLYV